MSITPPKDGEITILSGQYNKKCRLKVSPKSLQRTIRSILDLNRKSESLVTIIIIQSKKERKLNGFIILTLHGEEQT